MEPPGLAQVAVQSQDGEIYQSSCAENNKVPSGHHCLYSNGAEVTFTLQPSHTGGKIRAVDVRLSEEYSFTIATRERSTVSQWKYKQGFGVLKRDGCGCELFLHIKRFAVEPEIQIGDSVEHSVSFTLHVEKHEAVNPQIVSPDEPYQPVYRVWSPREVESNPAPEPVVNTMLFSGKAALSGKE